MEFADLHIHALYGVDDGAKTQEESFAMLDSAYSEGVRVICFTPHYHPGFFQDNRAARDQAFAEMQKIAPERWPDLHLCLGNELRYSPDCISWLDNGDCKTLNGTHYVLIDFDETEKASVIVSAVNKLLTRGYKPVLAHAERYRSLHLNLRELYDMSHSGALIQIDVQSILGEFGWRAHRIARAIIANELAFVIATDAHDMKFRPPSLHDCWLYVSKKCNINYAERLFWHNQLEILGIEPKK